MAVKRGGGVVREVVVDHLNVVSLPSLVQLWDEVQPQREFVGSVVVLDLESFGGWKEGGTTNVTFP